MEAGQEAESATGVVWMSASEVVWSMFFNDGMACSDIDVALDIPDGAARRYVVAKWADDKKTVDRDAWK